MSKEIGVHTAPNSFGKVSQWSCSMFYRKEGGKETVDLRYVKLVGFGLFGALILFILFNSLDEEFVAQRTISPPSEIITETPIELKGEVITASDYAFSDRPLRNSSKMVVRVFSGPSLIERPGALKIPPGAVVKAILATGASNGPVKAIVIESYSQSGDVLVKTGSALLGQGNSTAERLFVRFSRMIAKDGAVQTIQAQAIDTEDEQAGLKGSKLGQTALKLAGAIGLNFAGAFSEGLQESEVQNGVAIKKANVKNALLNGAARASIDLSKETMEDIKNGKPVIQVPKGKEILILFEGENE